MKLHLSTFFTLLGSKAEPTGPAVKLKGEWLTLYSGFKSQRA
jgi:hypothetical protein